MPIYEFRCTDCGTRLEERRPLGAADLPGPSCPDDGATMRRVLSVFATAGRATGADPAPMPSGGCGAGCACAS